MTGRREPFYVANMTEREKLLAEIERFLDRTGMGPTQFSEEAAGQRALMTRLKQGSDITLDTADRIRKYMRGYNAKKKPSGRRLEARVPA